LHAGLPHPSCAGLGDVASSSDDVDDAPGSDGADVSAPARERSNSPGVNPSGREPSLLVMAPVLLAPRSELEATTAAVRAAPSLEQLMSALVRHIAWSGDHRRGTARLEIGAGPLAGATLLVHADEGRVRVQLDVPPGVDGPAWRDRIAHGLAERRIVADEVEVR
jgi:hypothetical protein